MTLSNWIELALLAVIIAAGSVLYVYFKRKLYDMDGFEGIVIERGKSPRRLKLDAKDECEKLEELLKRSAE